MGMVTLADPISRSKMTPIDLNKYYSEIVYLTDEDLIDIDDNPLDLDLYFGPHLIFHLSDGGAILQHNRTALTDFVAASDARGDAQAEWQRCREAYGAAIRAEIVARFTFQDDAEAAIFKMRWC